MVQEITLKVAEAFQDDVNKGIVRIDSSFMHELGIRPGDIVEIEGARKTVTITDRAYPGDIGLKIIRMDGITRRNSKTGIGENVTIRKADVKEAKKLIIAPAHQGMSIQAHPTLFKNGLLGRVLVKGDIVPLGGANRRRSAMGGSAFNDIFNMLNENMPGFGFSDLKFIVADVSPKNEPVVITDQTEVVYDPEAKETVEEKVLEVTYEDIGGLGDEVKRIREMVEVPLKHPEIFEKLGIEPPKGVLLQGPPGTGKTLLAKAVANETASSFFLINGPEIMSKFYGQSEANIRKKFEEAEKNAPSIIFIDEIDAIAPKREETQGEVERRVVAQLLSLMDGLKSRGKVVVIAATNIVDSLDPALRRPGRFDREVEVGVPNKDGRLKILKIHTRNNPFYTKLNALKDNKSIEEDYKKALALILENSNDKEEVTPETLDSYISKYLKDNPDYEKTFSELDNQKLKEYLNKISDNMDVVNLHTLAEKTHGFVGADLASLSREAAMEVLRRVIPDLDISEDEQIPQSVLEKLKITMKDFNEALKNVKPSAMREVYVDTPTVTWDDVGGLIEVKQELKEAIEWPVKHPMSFRDLGVKPPRGVLLYGPPGTGKTLIAKAVAREGGVNFISVKGSELLSKYVNETPTRVKKIFEKARQVAPTIIFFDEVDAIASNRQMGEKAGEGPGMSAVQQLLVEMDGLEELNDVIVVAATNRPDLMDTALLRPGRFDRIVMVPVPDQKAREKIFEVHTKKMPIEGVDIKDLAKKSEGYVGADIEAVCREAAMLALRNDIKSKKVTKEYFDKAFDKVRPSASKEIQEAYAQLKDKFSSARAREMESEKPHYFG
ncbi:MAG: CDC48 family AAA ATPase [Nanoarchaeota archaeon]